MMKFTKSITLACVVALLGSQGAFSAEQNGMAGLTAEDLLKLLVDEGILDKEKVEKLSDKIKERNREDYSAAVEPVKIEERDVKPTGSGSVVRVPYIPEHVRDAIRDQVRLGLREDVTGDVLAQAKQERWGLPGVLPSWVTSMKFYGDVRVRAQGDYFGSDNDQGRYTDVNFINEQGGSTVPILSDEEFENDLFVNNTEDRHRMRVRARFGVTAKPTPGVEAGVRLVTGSSDNPVSTNQTVGDYGSKYDVNIDLAYVKFTNQVDSLNLSAGRIKNPFYSTELVWDSDLTFEGVSTTWHYLRSDDLDDDDRQWDPFITVSAFGIEEVDWQSDDKWLFALQTGFDYSWWDQDKLSFALSYYHYENITGEANEADSYEKDYTAPAYVSKGNSLYNIRNITLNPSAELLALSPEYHLVDAFLQYDLAYLSPIHIILTANYVKNIGFDADEIFERTGGVALNGDRLEEMNEGWYAGVTLGWPEIRIRGNWQFNFTYRNLESDAVLDAFTDSDFHLGGTNAKGYTLQFVYGLAENTYTSIRWLSSDEVDDAAPAGSGSGPFAVDTLLWDLGVIF